MGQNNLFKGNLCISVSLACIFLINSFSYKINGGYLYTSMYIALISPHRRFILSRQFILLINHIMTFKPTLNRFYDVLEIHLILIMHYS